ILDKNGQELAAPHAESGLQFGSVADVDLGLPSTELQTMTKNRIHDVKRISVVSRGEDSAILDVWNTAGDRARVEIQLYPNRIKFSVTPDKKGLYAILMRTQGISPAYGLSDHAAMGRESAEITGFESDYL